MQVLFGTLFGFGSMSISANGSMSTSYQSFLLIGALAVHFLAACGLLQLFARVDLAKATWLSVVFHVLLAVLVVGLLC